MFPWFMGICPCFMGMLAVSAKAGTERAARSAVVAIMLLSFIG
ncbi:hypothetical protein [Thiolapillus sp.]|nr:hypothetical protein [Thiolapillus sp.]